MKYTETKKLFFGKYLYRYKFKSPLAFYFYRTSNFNGMIAALDAAIISIEDQISKNKKSVATVKRWNRTYEVNQHHIDQIRELKNILVDYYGEFRTRTEFINLSIYTNNEKLVSLLETIHSEDAEMSKPHELAKSVLDGNNEIYIVNKPLDYKYRLTVSGSMKNSKEVAKWLEENSTKVKASSTAIRGFKKEYWLSNLLFYARDDKVLMLAQMMFGESIRKVEKIVFIGDIKVESENA